MHKLFLRRLAAGVRSLLVIGIILLTISIAYAVTINFAWNASVSSGVTGYRLYDGQASGTYTMSTDVGNTTTASWTGTMATGETRYFAATAYDAGGQESVYSNEVTYTVSQAPDTTPPTAPGMPTFSGTTSTQATLTWAASTDNVAVTGYRVERCQGAGCGNFAEIAQPGTNSYANTGLTASTTYLYRVRATDAAGNLSGYSASASVTTLAGPAPVASWNFDENTGTTSADKSGNAHTMTLAGGATWVAGQYASAVQFSGTSQWATTPDANDLDLTTGTIEAWFKLNALGKWHGIISKGTANSDSAHNYAIEVNNSNILQCVVGNGTQSAIVVGTTALTSGTWYHVACTWNGTNLVLYRNGVQVGSATQAITPQVNTAPFAIGRFGASSDPATADIDDVRVYNQALTGAQIATDMATPVGGGSPPPQVQGVNVVAIPNP